MEDQEKVIKQLIDELFRDEENVFFEPYRDGINYGVKKSVEEEIAKKFKMSEEEIHSYIQQILDATINVLNYIVAGEGDKIKELGELEEYINEKIPGKIKDYVLSRYILKKSMTGPVYYSIEITPVMKGMPDVETSIKTFVVRLKVDKEGTLFRDENRPEPILETIMFETTEHDLKEILEQIKEVIKNDEY